MSETRTSDDDPARRQLLRQALALAGGAALTGFMPSGQAAADAAVSDPHSALARRLSRIAFGCCAEESKPQPIWDAVLARNNDLFIFLGVNIYGDEGRCQNQRSGQSRENVH